MPDVKPFQVRSEETGLNNFATLDEALQAADRDRTIWKISFAAPSGERVRLIKENGEWLFRPIYIELE